jgi:hypothetical protein
MNPILEPHTRTPLCNPILEPSLQPFLSVNPRALLALGAGWVALPGSAMRTQPPTTNHQPPRAACQVSAASSPGRPVFPAVAAVPAAATGNGAHCYVAPTDPTSSATDAAAAATSAAATAAEAAPNPRAAATAAIPVVTACAAQLASHAVSLSPMSMSPATDQSGLTSPAPGSPLPSATRAGGGRGGRGRDGDGGGAGPPVVTGRFHAVRQAVDGAATAAAEEEGAAAAEGAVEAAGPANGGGGGSGGWTAAELAASPTFGRWRSVSASVSGGGASVSAANSGTESGGGAGEGAGDRADGFESAAGSSRAPSLMTESLPSELSFNSLLATPSFKS